MRQFVVSLVILGLVAFSADAQEIRIATAKLAPYNFEENGEITGMSTEVVRAVLRKAGITADFQIYPWVRAYKTALEEKNMLIYSITRTEEREPLFKWIGPIVPPDHFYLYKRKGRNDLVISSLEDAKKYKIGVGREGVVHEFLLKQGFEDGKNLDSVPENVQNYKKLLADRIDFCGMSPLILSAEMREAGLPFDQLERVLLLFERKEGFYMAFNKSTSDEVVERIRMAFEAVKEEGEVDRIVEKYVKKYQ